MSGSAEFHEQTDVQARRRKPLAYYVRGLLLAVLLLLPLAGRGTHLLIVIAALSPFVAITSTVATRAFVGTAVLGLAIAFVVLLRSRWLCRWLCPVGHCADGLGRLGRRSGRKTPKGIRLGRWIVLLTLAGAILGFPLLLWLDPLAMFCGAWGIFLRPANWLVAIPLLAVLLISFVWPHIWCSRLCPLGASQDILTQLRGRLRRTNVEQTTGRWNTPLTRRTVLGAGIGVACASAVKLTHGGGPKPLRPPGAIDEPDFLGVCVRCGNCIRICPSKIIEPAFAQYGLAGLLTPVVHFDKNYCLPECAKCMHVCPSGALARLSTDGKILNPIGLPKVDMNVCLLGESRECSECRRWCPHGAIRYEWSEVEYTLVPRIDPERCSGCGACEKVCPTKPRKAIVVAPLGDQPDA